MTAQHCLCFSISASLSLPLSLSLCLTILDPLPHKPLSSGGAEIGNGVEGGGISGGERKRVSIGLELVSEKVINPEMF